MTMTTDRAVMSTRALNRATLARQFLLERTTRPVFDVVEHLVGMQAQVPTDPYYALWSRIAEFDPAELESLILERRVARSPLMRTTIHLATADDCLGLRPLVQRVLTSTQRGQFGKQLARGEMEALAEAGRALFTERAMTFAQMRAALGEEWARYDRMAVGYSVSYLVPLVQVPPRGLWTKSAQATWTTTEAWFGKPLETSPSIDKMVLRYLGAFGPASVNDIQMWCGLTRLTEVADRLRPRLVTFRDENGRELFDLPDAPRPGPDAPAPPRFLPEYDNVFLSHADRSRIALPDARRRGALPTGRSIRPVFVDGYISGTWSIEREGKASVTLQIAPIATWSSVERDAVMAEGERLLAFAAGDAETREVRSSPVFEG